MPIEIDVFEYRDTAGLRRGGHGGHDQSRVPDM